MDDELSLKQQIETWQKQAIRNEISYEELEQRIRRRGEEIDAKFANGQLIVNAYKNLRTALLLIDTDNQQWRLFQGGVWRKQEEEKWVEGKPNLRDKFPKPNGKSKGLLGWVWAIVVLFIALIIGISVWVSWGFGGPTGTPIAVTKEPTTETTVEATTPPTDTPTTIPTNEPAVESTSEPTVEQTTEPFFPTDEPAALPTEEPALPKTVEPTAPPTADPTQSSEPEATTEPASTSPPTVEPPPTPYGTIAYPVFDDREQTYNLYLRSWPDITAPPRILPRLSQPAKGPNGLLAARIWDGSRQGIPKIDLASGSEQDFIPIPEALRPAWSPGGDIAFMALRDKDWKIFINEFSRQLPVDGSIGGPVWLNSQQIIFDGCVTNIGCGLYVVSLDGSGLRRLTDSGLRTHRNPALSPDGQQIAFMSNEQGQWDIYLIGIEATPQVKPTLLTVNSANDGLPAWSPDGRWIAYATNQDGQWVMQMQPPVASASPEVLFTLEGPPGGFVVDGPPGQEHEAWLQEQASWFN